MNKIFRLCVIQLKDIFSINKLNKKGLAGLIISATIIISFFLSLSIGCTIFIGNALIDTNRLNVLPTLFFSITSVVTLVTTLYQVRGVLFGSSDYELLLSLPIKEWQIVISKLITIYLYEFFFTIILMLPADIFYFVMSPDPMAITIMIVTIFCVPILPMAVSLLIGVLLILITERIPLKNIFLVLLNAALLVLILLFAFEIGYSSNGDIGDLVSKLVNKIADFYPIMVLYTLGCINGNVYYLLMYLAINIGVLIAISSIICILYNRINYWISKRIQYRLIKTQRVAKTNQFMALFVKECKTYFNSFLYFLSTIIGGLLAISFSVFFAYESFNGGLFLTINNTMINIIDFIKPYISIIICLLIGITSITSSSISMEGQCFWIIKTIPVDYKKYFGAKLLFNQIVIGGCALISSLVIISCIKMDIGEILMVLFNPQAYILLAGSIGLGVNLKYPKLQWNNEQTAVKNSASTFFSMICGFALIIVLMLLVFFISWFSTILAFILCCSLFIINGILLFFAIVKSAEKWMNNIDV